MSKEPIEKRFWKKVQKTETCWLWIAGINAGYGRFAVKKGTKFSSIPAHRFSYEQFKGKIPQELTIDHLCRVRNCVNPDHLEAVTMKENNARGNGYAIQNSKKTHCKYGHQYNEENTYYRPSGARKCRKCHAIKVLHNYYSKKSQNPKHHRLPPVQ